ncbi:MAG: tryptophan synthase subunit alpha [Gammaproteobacteria bacterium]|nr:tryptophan synthase subunit alpha [Gammaproteobacteria bacterium]
MSRLKTCFANLNSAGKKAVIPYIVGGDPTKHSTVAQMHALVKAGADVIELGVPFSDPMAEGPVIQLAHERALGHKTSLTEILGMVSAFRSDDAETPVVLMGYLNPVEVMGYEVFSERAQKAGVDGVLTVDLPPEESAALKSALSAKGIDSIFLIAPTTTDVRIKAICEGASGYLYYVSLKGVTGASHLDVSEVEEKVAVIRKNTTLPISVGFGIKDAASAKAIGAKADGVVVGSALVHYYFEESAKSDWDASKPPALIQSIRSAVDE